MPNWCEGTLKVRGTFENVRRWLKECLTVYDIVRKEDKNGHDYYDNVPNADKIAFQYDDDESDEMYIYIRNDAHIKGTRRNFVKSDEYWVYHGNDKDCIAVLNFKAAWGIETEPFADMSEKYCVNFRLHGYEMGMQYNQEVIVMGGEVVKNEETKFDNYDWECPFPLLGG